MPSATAVNIFLAISVVGSLATVLKLVSTGLARHYPLFTFLFLYRAADLVYPLVIPRKSDAYAYIYVITEPLFRVVYILVVLELYRLILEQYKGLYSLGRWVMYASSALAALISILTLLPHITPATPQPTKWLGYIFGFDRGVDLSLFVFILLMLLFLSRFPIKLSRNVIVHATLYSIYFFSSSTYGLMIKIFGLKSRSETNLVFQGIAAACTVAWFFLLTPAGEETKAVRLRFSPEYEQRALHKLEAINRVLLKSSRS